MANLGIHPARTLAMYRDYIDGSLSLHAVAERHGLTRQRAQQLFQQAGLPRRTKQDAARARWARERAVALAAMQQANGDDDQGDRPVS